MSELFIIKDTGKGIINNLDKDKVTPTGATQMNADWNSTQGVSKILNKPIIPIKSISGDYVSVNNTTGVVDLEIPTDIASTILGSAGIDPVKMVIDLQGNIYTANMSANNVSKITPDGTHSILGTTGLTPVGIVIDSEGNIYTTNRDSNNVSKITPDGVSTIFVTTGITPFGIIIDSSDNIYTSNLSSANVSKITPDGTHSILGTTGSRPSSIVMDSQGNIYTANLYSNNVSKITPDGTSTILGSTGYSPYDIAIDSQDNIYTVSGDNKVIKITPNGVSTNFATVVSGTENILIDPQDNIYVTNSNSNKVTKITPDGVSTNFATTGSIPRDIIMDSQGNIYTLNVGSNDITKIFKLKKSMLGIDYENKELINFKPKQNIIFKEDTIDVNIPPIVNPLTDTKRLLAVDDNGKIIRVNNTNSYSTTETLTGGTWIDGKPIYRKTVEITDFSSPDTVNGSLDLSIYFGNSIDEICNTPYFIVDHASNYGYKSYGNVLNIDAILSVTDGPTQGKKGLNAIAINAPFGTAFDISTLTSLIITLEYTKTTD